MMEGKFKSKSFKSVDGRVGIEGEWGRVNLRARVLKVWTEEWELKENEGGQI